jgi:hypothetical protein
LIEIKSKKITAALEGGASFNEISDAEEFDEE